MDFTDVVAKIVNQNARLDIAQAEVDAVVAGPPATVTIKIRGDTSLITGIRYLDSYSPTAADIVFCLINKGDILVLGKLA